MDCGRMNLTAVVSCTKKPRYTAQTPAGSGHACWGVQGAAAPPVPSLVILEKAFTAHCDITALFSLLSCLTLPVLFFLLLLFSINVCLFFSPVYSVLFSSFVSVLFCFYTVLFSLCPCPSNFLFLWLALPFCMLHTTPPRKGTCLIPYHCWSRNLWKESWSWWTTCQALCAIIMPSLLLNITTLRTRLIFLISWKVSIQTWFDWDL